MRLSGRIEQAGERREAAESIRSLILRNVSKYSTEDIQRAFDDHAQALADLAVAEHRFDELAERRGEASDQLKALRSELELVADAARDANLQSPDQEAVTFRNASRQVFQIIEEERMRIARDMHDGPAQSMSNLVLQAEILERLVGKPDAMLHELQDFKNSVRNALDETRQLIFDLRPMTLDDLGLVPTLRKYIKEYSDKHGLPVRFNVVGEERRLPGNTEGTLFRIIQEALTNVQKHSHSRGAEVTMSMNKDRVAVTIRDDGQGFDLASVEAKPGPQQEPRVDQHARARRARAGHAGDQEPAGQGHRDPRGVPSGSRSSKSADALLHLWPGCDSVDAKKLTVLRSGATQ